MMKCMRSVSFFDTKTTNQCLLVSMRNLALYTHIVLNLRQVGVQYCSCVLSSTSVDKEREIVCGILHDFLTS